MEFWGEEVKPGAKVSCRADEGYVIHLSQAALGETKKGSENVVVSIQVDDKKLVLGTLSVDKHPQIMCDLIFEDDFEISHSSKTASVFLCGYKSPIPIFEPDSGDDEISSDEELETEDIPIKNDEINDSEMSEDSDEETSSGADLTGDSEDETDDSEEQTPTPKKPEVVGKKRATEAVASSGKKAKVEPSGDKKGVHVSTPHPAKQASKTPAEKSGKTPATDKKSKDKSPKSGSHACKSCSKTFGSDKALESHKKAKHEA
ncbi:hypothetical protein SEVIR_5G427700v4 [Setaria viridis]|uniref:C2H2-type domain-containing protein n=1 Tax=Setaria viridis TaxID=4556 RepID=A0A4U6URR1_SETVI|nr:hypothetical protein SEVIR_5G427700v2 [Setaria viridis]